MNNCPYWKARSEQQLNNKKTSCFGRRFFSSGVGYGTTIITSNLQKKVELACNAQVVEYLPDLDGECMATTR
jgi:hypothetical protein